MATETEKFSYDAVVHKFAFATAVWGVVATFVAPEVRS
jgi:hypothetical protein